MTFYPPKCFIIFYFASPKSCMFHFHHLCPLNRILYFNPVYRLGNKLYSVLFVLGFSSNYFNHRMSLLITTYRYLVWEFQYLFIENSITICVFFLTLFVIIISCNLIIKITFFLFFKIYF